MKRYLLAGLCVVIALLSEAQTLIIETFKVLEGDISARTSPKKDLNGKDCALLKIWTLDDLTEIQGNNIGPVNISHGGEKWIYLTEGSQEIKLFFNNHLPISLSFNDYGIKRLKSGNSYLLVLTEDGGRPVVSSKPDVQLNIAEYPAKDEFEIGLSYLKGLNGRKINYEKAKQFLFMSADKGNGDAQYYLALMYYSGKGVEENINEAISWYSKAADNMQVDAMRDLGKMYIDGKKLDKDEILGIQLVSMAAERGNSEALNDLGYFYSKGIGVSQDQSKSVSYYQKASDRGNVIAMYNLALKYYKGEGVEQNLAKSAELYEKAAKLGDSYSQYNLGIYYERGIGVEPNLKTAVKWWKKAADQGHDKAIDALFRAGKL